MTHCLPGQSTCRNLSSRTDSAVLFMGTQIAQRSVRNLPPQCTDVPSARFQGTASLRRIVRQKSARRQPVRTCLRHVSKATRLSDETCDRNTLATAKAFRSITANRRELSFHLSAGLSSGGCLSAPIRPPGCLPPQCTFVTMYGRAFGSFPRPCVSQQNPRRNTQCAAVVHGYRALTQKTSN